MSSIFTKIINREIPAEIVYETERELAFLDINPISEGHTLVIPKIEVAHFNELPPEHLQSLIVSTQVITNGLMLAMNTPHYNITLNNGQPAGQVVFHVHFHIIPRYEGRPRSRGEYPAGKMGEIGEKIRQALA